jgi:hypothetical protein
MSEEINLSDIQAAERVLLNYLAVAHKLGVPIHGSIDDAIQYLKDFTEAIVEIKDGFEKLEKLRSRAKQ